MRQSRRLSRSTSGTFHHAFYLFPREQRDALHVIYRFCRLVDDAVDSEEPSATKEKTLDDLSQKLNGAGEGEPWDALDWVRRRYDIPIRYFHDLIEGARQDIGAVRIPDYPSLKQYCYRVAGTVGLMTLHVMGFRDRQAIPYSLAMGRAFQLTNILRDVGEDREIDRCYIPETLLRKYEAVADWEQERHTDNFCRALSDLGRRARLNYRQCLPLLGMVERKTRLPLALMTSAYSWYLGAIEERNYDVDSGGLRLPKRILPRLLWRSWRASRGRPELCLMMS